MDQSVNKKSIGMSLITSLIIAYLLTTTLLLVLAMLLYKMDLTEGMVNLSVCVIYVISSFIGGVVLGKKMGSKRFLWGAILGLSYFVLLGIISIAVQRGIATDIPHLITAFLMCLGAGTIGGMLS